ncbi:MAG: hypothetical protein EP349_05435 [Alphaproteobacteria bacterium]|nr:MAG: hypothetical protein EP349_05435 [Alphaproteobacteria bacterium]
MVLIAAIYGALLAMLFLMLSIHVVTLRRELGIAFGDGGKDDLTKAVRAHGNFAEYVPMALILFVMLELNGTSDYLVHLLGGALVLARTAHASGLIFSKNKISKRRVFGTALTWIVIGVAGTLLISNSMNYVY